jgi:hypothetical protein
MVLAAAWLSGEQLAMPNTWHKAREVGCSWGVKAAAGCTFVHNCLRKQHAARQMQRKHHALACVAVGSSQSVVSQAHVTIGFWER